MSTVVNIFEYAMQMEKDGENYYRKLSQRMTNKGLQIILLMLAEDEVKHCNVIEKMQAAEADIAETTVLMDAKSIFSQIKESGESFSFDIKETELYIKARDIGERSWNFYLEKAGEVKEGYQRELFLRLAKEEKKHYFLLDNIITFMSEPQRWLENAEFCHLEEY